MDDALNAYSKALAIYRHSAKTNPDVYLTYVALTLSNLALLDAVQGRFVNAKMQIKEAKNIYVKFVEIAPNRYQPQIERVNKIIEFTLVFLASKMNKMSRIKCDFFLLQIVLSRSLFF